MSTSARKLAANRANAQKSTGPRTAAGKAVSSRNACKVAGAAIGILASLRSENIADLAAIRAAMTEQYQPANIQESQLIEVISNAYVRLQRVEEISTQFLDGVMDGIQKRHGVPTGPTSDDAFGVAAALSSKDNDRAWKNLERYRSRAAIDYHRAIEALNKLQFSRREEPCRERRRQEYLENHRARTIAPEHRVTLHENEPNNEPITPADSTPVASFSDFSAVLPDITKSGQSGGCHSALL